MKKLALFLVVFFATVLLFNGCKKEEDKNPDDTLPEVITGNVLLPAGSVTDANTLTVINFQDEMGVSENTYEINALNEHTTLFVVDDNDEVIMMSYLYPGQTDFTIDAGSTTLALLMNMPFSFQIGADGKTNFTNKILGDADFQNIVTATENLLIQGISPFDTTQTAYALQLSQYLVDVSAQKTEQTNGAPAQILRAGKVLTIQNSGKSYATAVGIYKNGSIVKSFEIDRIKFVPTSEAQTLAAINGSYLLPEVISSEPYTMQDDADYEIRVRNGNAELNGIIDWSSDENRAAHIKNTKNFCIDVVTNVLPLDGCLPNITNSLYGFIDNIFLTVTNPKEISVTSTFDLVNSWFSFVGNGLSCLTQSLSWARFKLIAKKYLGWTAWVQRLGTVGNQVVGIAQMHMDESALDTCFKVVGNTVTPGGCATTSVTYNGSASEDNFLCTDGCLRLKSQALDCSATFYLDAQNQIDSVYASWEYTLVCHDVQVDTFICGFCGPLESVPRSYFGKMILVGNGVYQLTCVLNALNFTSSQLSVTYMDSMNVVASFSNNGPCGDDLQNIVLTQ